MDARTFYPGPTPGTVRDSDGTILTAPEGWALLPPGDAGLTRRVKAAGEHWVVQEKMGRRMSSRGVWAPAATIDRIRAEMEAERSTEVYARKQEAASRRREEAQGRYVEDFHGAVLTFLAFHDTHPDLVARLAKALGTSVADLLPEAGPPDPLPILKEQAAGLMETLRRADRDTLMMVVPLLARLLESPTRRR